ncbi:hypothetical protein F0238_21555 [Vibrio coralliilyticus]|uniref:Uncharacterized protein n=2 Tax=Vibrio coralliilyticus TaxID=190893 RepID=A0AAP7DFG2_9VIBR|nr:hypothetical protein [Vibrio coralliilyticus]NOI31872.1 hypothetical protein [Vibrio coralliilyticus]NOJ25316.1 hypothetical protein [Vibrio coralliilyticus]
MSRYVTVVYAIEDEEAFKPVLQDIQKQMAEFDVNNRPPVGICAVSSSNEIQRLGMIEEALDDSDSGLAQDTAQAILSLAHLPEPNQKEVLLA